MPLTVGHVPLDVSRVSHICIMEPSGILEGKVYDTKCQVRYQISDETIS